MSQTVPIVLVWSPVGTGVSYTDINSLGGIIAAQLAANIEANVTFCWVGPSTPSSFETNLIFNTSEGVWLYWDSAGSGRYIPVTQFNVGDIKWTFNAGDAPTQGWIVCDGRLITAIPNLSQYQVAALETLFGTGGSLPTVSPVQSLAGLPPTQSFASIKNPSILPSTGTFSGLTINNPPAQADVQAVATNSETLDVSVQGLQQALAQVIQQSENMLDSLQNSGSTTAPTMYAQVFCGFP
jgi:microcystin-dependent protein